MWHYQWILLHDYLPVADRRRARRPSSPTRARASTRSDGEPYIPFEFADAAFRYGHSQIRHRYRINARRAALPMFPDLMGFGAVPPERAVDWCAALRPAGPAAGAARRSGWTAGCPRA